MSGITEQRVCDLGEEALVRKLTSTLPSHGGIVVGPGDDCAVVRSAQREEYTLLKTDCVIESVHFLPGTDPELVGRKAMNRVLSDIAAMGGRPSEALITVATDSERSVAEIEGWYRGLVEASSRHHCVIAGGETASLPNRGAMLSIAMTGIVSASHLVLRSGASVGDLILVTGALGGSFASGRHLTFEPRLEQSQWLAKHAKPTSMMDLSDGLGSDLPRLVQASGLGYEVARSSIPCHEGASVEDAISDGEDYELLLTMPENQFAAVEEEWKERWPDLSLSAIGRVVTTTKIRLEAGWEHHRNV